MPQNDKNVRYKAQKSRSSIIMRSGYGSIWLIVVTFGYSPKTEKRSGHIAAAPSYLFLFILFLFSFFFGSDKLQHRGWNVGNLHTVTGLLEPLQISFVVHEKTPLSTYLLWPIIPYTCEVVYVYFTMRTTTFKNPFASISISTNSNSVSLSKTISDSPWFFVINPFCPFSLSSSILIGRLVK